MDQPITKDERGPSLRPKNSIDNGFQDVKSNAVSLLHKPKPLVNEILSSNSNQNSYQLILSSADSSHYLHSDKK
jgi:hypothetical protein